MRRPLHSLRVVLLALVAGLLVAAPLRAEDPAPAPDEWQAVISGQIQAFRDHDAEAAIGYAGASFHTLFPDPKKFYFTIMTTGYLPIITSRSHSFGPYELAGPDDVIQHVIFVDEDQSLYDAVYQVVREPEGWRVQGVLLTKQPGIGV